MYVRAYGAKHKAAYRLVETQGHCWLVGNESCKQRYCNACLLCLKCYAQKAKKKSPCQQIRETRRRYSPRSGEYTITIPGGRKKYTVS